MSAEKFARLGKRVNVIIFWGSSYTYGDTAGKWKVQVEFKDNGIEIKFEEHSQFIDTALEMAYLRLDKTVTIGLGASAMLPAIEHKTIDEEIPF